MTVLEIILLVLLAAALIALCVQYRAFCRYRNKMRDLNEYISNLKQKRPGLAHMARYLEEDESTQLIRYRYNLMGKLLAAGVSGDSSRISEIFDEVEALVADRDDFMRQTRLVYERMQPQMTDHLREKGLTDRQIEVCCLYALGLNGKTIQQYTRDGRHFQHVGHIRKKLGLGEHDQNINGYIRSLLK